MEMANRIIGGDFSSRLNMNLREDKHWSYGSGSYFSRTQGQGLFMGYAPVQTDKTKESVIEFKKEMEDFVSTKPITEEEFKKFRKNAVMQLPGRWETNQVVAYDMSQIVRYGVDEQYLYGYADMMRSMKLEELRKIAQKQFHPANITWVIVGDRKKIEEGVKSLSLGTIKYVNTDGIEVK
jgi:zinc protease